MTAVGSIARDKVTGFTGVVVAITHNLKGEVFTCLASVVKRDNTFSGVRWIRADHVHDANRRRRKRRKASATRKAKARPAAKTKDKAKR